MSEGTKKILFLLRSDAAVKSGGDLVQARFYKKALEAEGGYEVSFSHEISLDTLKKECWDLVQIFNVSRLHENMAVLQGGSYRRLLLSPIVQPGFDFGLKLAIKNFVRNLLWSRFSFHRFLKDPRDLLREINGFVFLSEAERDAFFCKFPGFSKVDSVIYENGVAEGLEGCKREKAFDFINVGRIEPKKRVVEVIDSVSDVAPKSTLICIGGVNWYHPLYCLRFFLRVFRGKVIYLGKRDASEVYEFMGRTRILLNFSELEVSPLVDLEALACGCSVVSTIYSYSHLPVGECFDRIDVKDISQCAGAIRKSLERDDCEGVKVNTWAENSSAYIKLVSDLLDARKPNGVVECVAP